MTDLNLMGQSSTAIEDYEKRKQEKYLLDIPETMQNVFKKAYSGESRANGVKAKCLDCCNFQRKEVGLCEITTCPLYAYRPFSSKDVSGEAIEEIEL